MTVFIFSYMCIDYMESKEWTWSYASSETQIMQGMCSSVTHGIMQGILHVKLTSIYIQNC